MAHSLQDGLGKFERILERIADNPDQLEYDRSRFEDPILGDTTPLSGNTTPSPAPRVRDLKAELDDKREQGWKTSYPGSLFVMQAELETTRYTQAFRNGCRPIPNGQGASALAIRDVRNQWIKQGIWDYSWDAAQKGRRPMPLGFWRHEDEKGPDHAILPDDVCIYKLPQFPATAHPETPFDPDSSRPMRQFIFQVETEREWFKDWHRAKVEGFPSPESGDINTLAYHSVKKRWEKWGIWDSEWGLLPGMSWQHEIPLREFLERERQKDAAAAAANGTADQDQVQYYSVYESPVSSITSDDDRNLDFRQFIVHGNNSLESLVDEPNSQGAMYSLIVDPAPERVIVNSGLPLDESSRASDESSRASDESSRGPDESSRVPDESSRDPEESPSALEKSTQALEESPQALDESSRALGASPPNTSPHPAETVPAQTPASDSSPEPSIAKSTERNGRYKSWQALFRRPKSKTSKDSSKRLRFLKHIIWIEREEKVVKH